MNNIIVIDFSPELFWYVNGSLGTHELDLKHYPDSHLAEKIVCTELPEIVILNGDDTNINISEFIGKMRNHIFARNTLFIVFTSNPDFEFRRKLIIAGAAQVFYRTNSYSPEPKDFANTVDWLLEYKMKDSHFKFDQTFYPFQSEAELTTWGRMGWISENRCLIETNLDLKPGESIPVECSLFDDLGLKNVKFVCIEKNQVGRYYQYAHSLLGKIETKNTEVDLKKVKGWINDNAMISKNKPVKLVFFEADPQQRDKIAKMIKLDKRYCARGYKDITNFEETLHYQYPNLILINRNLIQKNKAEFEAIRRFVKENFCFCITYALDESLPIEEFKKNYEFAMHVINPIDEKLLESMILKLEQKIPSEEKSLFPKVFFNKYSAYSRMSFYSKILITDISTDGLQIRSPFSLNSFCSIEILSPLLYTSKLGRMQLFRAIEEKKNSKTIDGILHKLIFIGHTQKEKNTVKDIIQKIQEKKEAN